MAIAPTTLPGRRAPKRSFTTPVIYFIALVLVGLMLVPIAYIILGGFRSNSEITVDPSGFQTVWQVSNYIEVLTNGVFWRQVANSTIAAVARAYSRSMAESYASQSGTTSQIAAHGEVG